MKQWVATVGQVGAVLLTAFGGFYSNIAPPDDDLKFWPSYASLVAGLIFVACRRLGDKATLALLWLAIPPAIALPVYYYSQYQNLVVKYSTSKVICGTEYTTQGAKKAAETSTKEDLVFAFQGKVKDIWTEASVNRAHLRLGLVYSSGFAFLALALLTGLHATKGPPQAAPSVKRASATK